MTPEGWEESTLGAGWEELIPGSWEEQIHAGWEELIP
jgi:hypothetical protein